MATNLIDLIDTINADDLPTNEFTIEDEDKFVLLGKLNEVIASLQMIQDTITSSDTTAQEALTNAQSAVADALEALTTANGINAKATEALSNAVVAVSTANDALEASNNASSASNTALSTANTALSSANSAVSTANTANTTASSAETKADEAVSTANDAETTANGIDAKATEALSNSQYAVITANDAEDKADEALQQVVESLGTKINFDGVLQSIVNFLSDPQTQIDNEITARTTADTNLQGSINAEVEARTTADTTLQANIDSEASSRSSADTNLQANIDSEASSRSSADALKANLACDNLSSANIDAWVFNLLSGVVGRGDKITYRVLTDRYFCFKYASGLIIQGQYLLVGGSGSQNSYTINYIQSFTSSTSHITLTTYEGSSSTTTYYGFMTIGETTASQFKAKVYGGNVFNWFAIGY